MKARLPASGKIAATHDHPFLQQRESLEPRCLPSQAACVSASDAQAGQVYAQSPAAGTSLANGRTVQVVVLGKLQDDGPVVPNFVGRSRDEAEAILGQAGIPCQVGEGSRRRSSFQPARLRRLRGNLMGAFL